MEYWTLEARARREAAARVPRELVEGRRAEGGAQGRRDDARARRSDARRRDVRRRDGRQEGAAPQPAAALHHGEAAAGGGEPARLHGEEDDDARAAALRGRRARRGGRGRPHHVHAHGLGAALDRGGGRGARLHRGGLRQGPPARGAERLQDEGEVGAGGPRGRPSDLAGVDAGARRAVLRANRRARHVPAVRAHLEPVRRVPDGPGGLRPDHGRHRRRRAPTFRATGSILKFPGYLAVYGAKPPEEEAGAEEEPKDERRREKANEERQLPAARGRGDRSSSASSCPSSTSRSRRPASTSRRS